MSSTVRVPGKKRVRAPAVAEDLAADRLFGEGEGLAAVAGADESELLDRLRRDRLDHPRQAPVEVEPAAAPAPHARRGPAQKVREAPGLEAGLDRQDRPVVEREEALEGHFSGRRDALGFFDERGGGEVAEELALAAAAPGEELRRAGLGRPRIGGTAPRAGRAPQLVGRLRGADRAPRAAGRGRRGRAPAGTPP
jgi:hypothetical protein